MVESVPFEDKRLDKEPPVREVGTRIRLSRRGIYAAFTVGESKILVPVGSLELPPPSTSSNGLDNKPLD